jgi:hypothetical protein
MYYCDHVVLEQTFPSEMCSDNTIPANDVEFLIGDEGNEPTARVDRELLKPKVAAVPMKLGISMHVHQCSPFISGIS